MSNTKKYVMEKGKFILHRNSKEFMEENPKRPTHWGDLVIPEGCKAGDTLKLSAWSSTSQNGNPYLDGRADLRQMPEHVENSDNEDNPF